MINIRFHIVSLIAVFMALAIGIVAGSTLLDRATVEFLRSSMDRVQGRNDELSTANDAYKKALDRVDSVEAGLTEHVQELLRGTIDGREVVLITMRGLNETSVSEVSDALSQAGANLRGTLWIEQQFNLNSANSVVSLAKTFGLPDNSRREEVIDLFGSALTRQSQPVATREALTDEQLARSADLIATTERSGFVDWEPRPQQPANLELGADARITFVLLTGEQAILGEYAFVMPLARVFGASDTRLVVAEMQAHRPLKNSTTPQLPERGTFVSAIRKDQALNDKVVTLDNADRLAGKICLAEIVAGLDDLSSFSFGEGAGAERPFPPKR